jgi:hypothetical protein
LAAEETRIICVLVKAHTIQDLPDFIIPMLWATSQTVERTF